MKLLLYGINYSPELTGIGKYSGEMGDWLGHQKAELRVITAPPYYPNWKVSPGYSGRWYRKESQNGVEVIRCPLYVPSRPITVSRILHLFSFSFSSFWALFSYLRWRPDVIIAVAPAFFCAPAALLFGTVTGAKTVIHIQDYEIDAMFGLGMMKPGIIAKLVVKAESWILRRFDRVSSISNSMMDLAVKKGVDSHRVLFLPNWVDTDFIIPSVSGDAYRAKWGHSAEQRLLLYSGNIGQKQGVEIIVEAARFFESDNNLQFVIVGQGAYRAELERLVRESGLKNIHFRDLVPYEELPQLLAMADIHLVVQKKGAADVVLPSKLTSILSAGGHALITAEKETELGFLMEKYPGIAELVEPEELDAFVNGINRLLKKDTRVTNQVARDYAVEHLNKGAILPRFYGDLCELRGSSVGADGD